VGERRMILACVRGARLTNRNGSVGKNMSCPTTSIDKETEDFDLPPENRALETSKDPAENVESDARARPQQIPGLE
jgi:hypothetical protein